MARLRFVLGAVAALIGIAGACICLQPVRAYDSSYVSATAMMVEPPDPVTWLEREIQRDLEAGPGEILSFLPIEGMNWREVVEMLRQAYAPHSQE